MRTTLTVTYEEPYDESDEEIPVMCVAESDLFSTKIIKMFAGEKAERLYKALTGQNMVIKVESEDKE